MSPSWRETLHVELGAHELRLCRLSRGWRPAVSFERRQRLAGLTLQAAEQALAEALQALPTPPRSGTPATVQLSSDWVRFALQTQAGALRGSLERQAAASHALRRVYGETVQYWQVAACDAGDGTLLAAGIDGGLNEVLARALRGVDARLVSAQPALALAVNRCRRWLDKPSWLVSLEPGLATLAYLDGQRLRTLRCHRVRHALKDELPVWLDQARLIDGLAEPEVPLVVVCPHALAGEAAQLPLASRVIEFGLPATASAH